MDRIGEKIGPGKAAVALMRLAPAVDGTGNGQRGERAAHRDLVTMLPIPLDRRQFRGWAAGVESLHAVGTGTGDQPEAVATKAGHVRVDDAEHRVGGDCGIDRTPAFA